MKQSKWGRDKRLCTPGLCSPILLAAPSWPHWIEKSSAVISGMPPFLPLHPTQARCSRHGTGSWSPGGQALVEEAKSPPQLPLVPGQSLQVPPTPPRLQEVCLLDFRESQGVPGIRRPDSTLAGGRTQSLAGPSPPAG